MGHAHTRLRIRRAMPKSDLWHSEMLPCLWSVVAARRSVWCCFVVAWLISDGKREYLDHERTSTFVCFWFFFFLKCDRHSKLEKKKKKCTSLCPFETNTKENSLSLTFLLTGQLAVKVEITLLDTGKVTNYLLHLFVRKVSTSQQHAEYISGTGLRQQFFVLPHWDVAGQTCYLTLSQYADTRPTSPSADPVTPGAWQDSQSTLFFFLFFFYYSVVWLDRAKRGSIPGFPAVEVDV